MMQLPAIKAMLEDFHARYPGVTGQNLLRLHNDAGHTSYRVLIDAAFAGHAVKNFLDIGCGDGVLLDEVRALHPTTALFGIDLSASEIAIAREALPAATLVAEDVNSGLPFPDKAFDAVVSHLVFMLLGNIDLAIDQVRRVLRPHGRFAFIIDDLAGSPSSYLMYLREAMRGAGILGENTRFDKAADPRVYDPEALRALLHNNGMEVRQHQRFSASGLLSKEALWAQIQGAYAVGALSAEDQKRARSALFNLVGNAPVNEISLPLQLIVAERHA